MTLGTPLFNSIAIAVIGAILSLFGTLILRSMNQRAQMRDRLTELEKQLAVMQGQVTPISAAMLEVWVKKLTHIHTPEMDGLMAEVVATKTLTKAKHKRLNTLLLERTKDMDPEISDDERSIAAVMPVLIKQVLEEAVVPVEEMDVLMVGIPKDIPK